MPKALNVHSGINVLVSPECERLIFISLQSVHTREVALGSDLCMGTGVLSVTPAPLPASGLRSVSIPLPKAGFDASLCRFSPSQILLAQLQMNY